MTIRALTPSSRFTGPVIATLALATLFLPWLRTGSTKRSAFRLVAALRDAGLMTRGAAQVFFAAVALIPGVVAAGWLLGAARLPRLAATATATAGLLTTATALTVRQIAHHRATPGSGVAVAIGVATVLSGVALILFGQATAPALAGDLSRA